MGIPFDSYFRLDALAAFLAATSAGDEFIEPRDVLRAEGPAVAREDHTVLQLEQHSVRYKFVRERRRRYAVLATNFSLPQILSFVGSSWGATSGDDPIGS